MTATIYMFGVFVGLVIWSAWSGVTRKGAMQEIAVRGTAGVGLTTHKVADGTATLGDKIGIVVVTVLGSLMNVPFIVVSAVVGGILYLVVKLFF